MHGFHDQVCSIVIACLLWLNVTTGRVEQYGSQERAGVRNVGSVDGCIAIVLRGNALLLTIGQHG